MKPLKESQKREFPPLAVFDIEATEWINLRLLCHLDEYGNRRYFSSAQEYVIWLLTEYQGKAVWSHFGSGYDNRFLIEALLNWDGTSFKAIMSGGLPIILVIQNALFTEISEKTGRPRPKQVILYDSFRLLPTSLANIGRSLGTPKMEVDRSRIQELSPAELRAYCMSDCEILLHGLQRFRDTVRSNGGHYAATAAATASNFIRADPAIDWKRFFDPDTNYQQYSGERFARGEPGARPGMVQADDFAESAMFGGRCEVYKLGQFDGPLWHYDIASAYPWAMRHALPFYFRGFFPGAMWEDRADLLRILKAPGISDAQVHIPQGTFEFPPLPVRTPEGKVLFPEGLFHGRWTNLELFALYKRAHERGIRIDVTSWARFQAVPFARPFVDRFYSLRRAAKDKGDEGDSMVLKTLLNACYGKLAQQREQSSFVFGDGYDWARKAAEHDGRLKPSPLAGMYEIVEESDGPFRHVTAGAYVTAFARLHLLEGIETARRHGATVYYCDTDSLVLDRRIPAWGRSTALGAWELEKRYTGAEFLCPKVYRAECIDGSRVLKAKGTNLKSQLELSDPRELHEQERLYRWCVYAEEISPFARAIVRTLTPEQVSYYGKVQAGLVGWRTGARKGDLSCEVAELDRSAHQLDSKRLHRKGSSEPLYLTGEGGLYLDVRTADLPLLELEGEIDGCEHP